MAYKFGIIKNIQQILPKNDVTERQIAVPQSKPIKVKFGRGELVLTKSDELVGVKTIATRSLDAALPKQIKSEKHEYLGGFQIVELKKEGSQDINKQLDKVRSLDEVSVGTHVYHIAGNDKPIVPTGKIYIQFKENTSIPSQNDILAKLNLALRERRDDFQVVAEVTPLSSNPLKCAAAIQALDEVRWAEPDIDIPLDHYVYSAPTARFMPQMWHLQNRGIVPDNPNVRLKTGADARIVEAWRRLDGFGNPNIVVAVMDNGFDLSHPDLLGKIVKPFDFWNNSAQLRQGDPAWTHGTPCASLAIAPTSGSGMVGVAPVARFMPLSGTSFSIEGTEAMFNYVIRNGADVVSCSWGTIDNSFALGQAKIAAIAKAAREGRGGKGCVILFASGNEDVDFVNLYAAHPDVICVAASDSNDQHAPYSNRGREVTICAPSNGYWPLLAARPIWAEGSVDDFYYGDGIDRGIRYQHFGGTSAATPIVAGICALILSANPNLTAREVKKILTQTADKVGSPSDYIGGHSVKYGYGRVNALKAVEEALRLRNAAAPQPTPTPQPTPSVSEIPVRGLVHFGTNRLVSNKGFSVHIGSFSQWSNVKSVAQNVEKQWKIPILVHVVGAGSNTMYRVLAGYFTSAVDAQRLQNSLKTGGINGNIRDLATLS